MASIDEPTRIDQQTSDSLSQNRAYTEDNVGKGFLGDQKIEGSTNLVHDQAVCERVIGSRTNAWIILGRDRPGNIASGASSTGATGAAMIDLVAGKASSTNIDVLEGKSVSPLLFNDAARVYISQRCENIDKYFGLAQSEIGSNYYPGRSGIGIKADNVRIIAREGIKLVTGKARDVTGAGPLGEPNSLNGDIAAVKGIELIAGNVSDDNDMFSFSTGPFSVKQVQPMVKGDNLVKAMSDLTDFVGTLASNLRDFMATQMRYNQQVAIHTHIATVPGGPTSPAIPLAGTVFSTKANVLPLQISTRTLEVALKMFEANYLLEDSKLWICSRYNKTN
jgi:hypothetical protein